MSQSKYTLGQKLEVCNLPLIPGVESWNGEIVAVEHLPGHSHTYPHAYGVRFKDGTLKPAIEQYLRPFPPVLPNGRGDIDTKVTWGCFEHITGIPASVIILGRNGQHG